MASKAGPTKEISKSSFIKIKDICFKRQSFENEKISYRSEENIWKDYIWKRTSI